MLRNGERLRVAVLMGGPSSEHEVSLEGGRNVAEALDPHRFEVRPVVITREGRWRMPARDLFAVAARARRARGGGGGDAPAPTGRLDGLRTEGWREFPGPLEALTWLRDWGADVVMPVLHGRFGEDGTVQACLAAAGLPFVGSAAGPSAIAIDKVHTKEILAFHGLPTPPFAVLRGEDLRRGRAATARRLVERLGAPIVIKEPCGGSSLEVRIADDEGEVLAAIEALVPPATRLLAEAHVAGRELTVGVLHEREHGAPVALPVVEIVPRRGRCFDYEEKYSPDGADELCPAPVDDEVARRAQTAALAVHRHLGLRGLSRTDMILDPGGGLHLLEVNTMPGMTGRGLVPLAARAVGIPFPALIERLVRGASR